MIQKFHELQALLICFFSFIAVPILISIFQCNFLFDKTMKLTVKKKTKIHNLPHPAFHTDTSEDIRKIIHLFSNTQHSFTAVIF